MFIRKATSKDLPDILAIYSYARTYMKEHGNPDQWRDSYPPVELTTQNIDTGCCYVCIIQENEQDKIGGVFYFHQEDDPDYKEIDGAWLNDDTYAVVHRVATAPDTKGVATYCLNWAYEQFQNIKIDTHDDNIPMQHLLKKLGFSCCGHTTLANGEVRLVYQKCIG